MSPVSSFCSRDIIRGQDNLFREIKQLQAGEVVVIEQIGDTFQIRSRRYYQFLHMLPQEYDEKYLLERLEQVAVRSIERLVRYADGRQIVIPLSGGYDSRLIATFLHRARYPKVITYSYGPPNGKEPRISREVSRGLRFPWIFVDYSYKKWRKTFQHPELIRYLLWASGWSSLPHIQDWIAVKVLRARGWIEKNSVFVPGHSGDFVAGSHIPEEAFLRSEFNQYEFADAVLTHHYNLAPLIINRRYDKSFCLRCILDKVGKPELKSNIDFVNYYEMWDWQERQAKYIVNSVRVYEYFGYDWWLPLWDLEFVKFWESVPFEFLKKRRWYANFVRILYARQIGVSVTDVPGHDSDKTIIEKPLVCFVKDLPKGLRNPLTELIFDFRHNRFLGANLGASIPLIIRGFKINGILATIFLNTTAKIKRTK